MYLIDPMGNVMNLNEDDSKTYSNSNNDGYAYLSTEINNLTPGDWQLLYSNFNNITKKGDIKLESGNATSYVHNGTSGNISIYYDASSFAHDFTVTWENATHAVTNFKLTAPDGTVYSKETTPDNIIANEYGRFVIKVPNLIAGNYKFEIKGDELGRVWFHEVESVAFTQEPVPETEAVDEAIPTTQQ